MFHSLAPTCDDVMHMEQNDPLSQHKVPDYISNVSDFFLSPERTQTISKHAADDLTRQLGHAA